MARLDIHHGPTVRDTRVRCANLLESRSGELERETSLLILGRTLTGLPRRPRRPPATTPIPTCRAAKRG
jgi:hypothetical protein